MKVSAAIRKSVKCCRFRLSLLKETGDLSIMDRVRDGRFGDGPSGEELVGLMVVIELFLCLGCVVNEGVVGLFREVLVVELGSFCSYGYRLGDREMLLGCERRLDQMAKRFAL
jgi:hypothetical protein